MCPRKLWYQRWGAEACSEPDAKSLRIFRLGDAIHDDIRRALRRAGFKGDIPTSKDEESELSIEVAFGDDESETVTGHPDAILRDVEVDGEVVDVLVEIKSIGPAGWPYLFKEGPKEDHIAQASVYATAADCTKCLYIYYQKGTSEVACWLLDTSVEAAQRAWEGWRKVLEAGSEAPPERAYEPVQEVMQGCSTGRKVLPWQCSYCDYAHPTCWGDSVTPDPTKAGKPRFVHSVNGEAVKPAPTRAESGWEAASVQAEDW